MSNLRGLNKTLCQKVVNNIRVDPKLRLDPKQKTNVKQHWKNILEFRRNKKSQNKKSEKNIVKK